MSEQEYHKGKLKEVPVSDLEKFCKEQVGIERGIEYKIPEYYDSFTEYCEEHGVADYIIIGEKVFQLLEHKEERDLDFINEFKKNEDGTYDFVFYFYNGGTCFEEMLEEGLDKEGQL